MMLLPAVPSCPGPGVPVSLFYSILYKQSWMDVDGRSQFLARFGANPPGILLFHALGFSWSSHAPSPLFLTLFLRFPSYLLESFHVLALCVHSVVCVYIYTRTQPHPHTLQKENKGTSFMPSSLSLCCC
jgi:hypothetical protein